MSAPSKSSSKLYGGMVRPLLGLGLLLGAFLGLAFGAAAAPFFPAVDLPLARAVQFGTPEPLGWVFISLSALGQRAPMSLLMVAAAALFWWGGRRLEGAFIAATLAPGLANAALKLLVDRPRPDAALVRVLEAGSSLHESSFPSGHAVQFTVVFGLLFLFAGLTLEGRSRRLAQGALLAAIVLVGPARVYMGAHWPSDVLGGYLLGGMWLWGLAWLYLKLRPLPQDPAPAAPAAPVSADTLAGSAE